MRSCRPSALSGVWRSEAFGFGFTKAKAWKQKGRNAAAVNVEATQEHDIDSARRRLRPDQQAGGCRC